VSNLEAYEQQKRATRIMQAKLCIDRAERYTSTRPGGTATELVRDLRLSLKELIEELNRKPATG
jgi:hypothetical protein